MKAKKKQTFDTRDFVMLDFVPVLLCRLLDDENLQDLIRFQCRVPIDPIYYSIDFPLVLRLTCWRPFSKHIWQLKLELEMIKYRPVYGSGNLFFLSFYIFCIFRSRCYTRFACFPRIRRTINSRHLKNARIDPDQRHQQAVPLQVCPLFLLL